MDIRLEEEDIIEPEVDAPIGEEVPEDEDEEV